MVYEVVMITFPRRKSSVQTVTVSGKTRYPASGDLTKPWVGFYVHNQSATTSMYFDIDNEIEGTQNAIEVPPGEFRDFNLIVEKYICFYSTASVSCTLVAYVEPFTADAIKQWVSQKKQDSSQVYVPDKTPAYLEE